MSNSNGNGQLVWENIPSRRPGLERVSVHSYGNLGSIMLSIDAPLDMDCGESGIDTYLTREDARMLANALLSIADN